MTNRRLLRAMVTTLLCSLPTASMASTFTCGAGDVGCVIATINIANANGEPSNTIRLAAGTYTFNAANNATNGLNALPTITSSLTIVADVTGSTVVWTQASSSVANRFRYLHVAATGSLTLDGLTLSNGGSSTTTPQTGSTVYNSGGFVSITKSVFSSNEGPAVFNNAGVLAIDNSTFFGNIGVAGGTSVGDVGGLVTINGSVFAGGACRDDGVILATSSRMFWILDSVFTSVQCDRLGAVVTIKGGAAAIHRSTFSQNAVAGRAVVAALQNASVVVRDSAFVDNLGDGVGAVDVQGSAVDVMNSTFINNNIAGQAGSVLLNAGGRLSVLNDTIAGNSGTVGLGAIGSSSGTTTVQNSLVQHSATAGTCPVNAVVSLGHNVFDGAGALCGVQLASSDITGPLGTGGRVNTGQPGRVYLPLLPGSSAIDGGDAGTCPAINQLGQARQGICDIGAVESAGGTSSSIRASVVDADGAVWTINTSSQTLRNGVAAGGGFGLGYELVQSVLYVLAPDRTWWRWTGSSWVFNSTTDPGAGTGGGSTPTLPSPSPDGTRSLTIVDANGATWTIGANRETLRNGVQAAGGFGTSYFWYQSVLYILAPDNTWWKWTGTAWIYFSATQPGLSPSPSGTRSTAIVDADLATWTIGTNRETLRNGVHVAGGLGESYLWYQNMLYVLAPDGTWWKWTGTTWTFFSATEPGASPSPSPSGTRGTTIVDADGATWTIGANRETLRNGVQAGGGFGTSYLWYQGVLYVLAPDNTWWKWTGTAWIYFSATQPGASPSPSPSGTRGTTIVDADGATWTIGANRETLRNGVQAGGGFGTSYLWYQGVLYVLAPDNTWWKWTGTAWIYFSAIQPGTTPSASPSGTQSTTIVDADGATWTIGANRETLRNGVQAAAGFGTTYFWYQNVLYVLAPDSTWWQWTGTRWVFYSVDPPGITPDGTRATIIVTNDGVTWTLGASGEAIRDGVLTRGIGSLYLWYQHVLYIIGTDGNWWQWNGTGWVFYSSRAPNA